MQIFYLPNRIALGLEIIVIQSEFSNESTQTKLERFLLLFFVLLSCTSLILLVIARFHYFYISHNGDYSVDPFLECVFDPSTGRS
ncbi:hypothetical protein SAMN04488552_0424 [Christiangramia echinicola]|uniref:Uncharacterized protein n=1 Tax=Christiangramia echinicola TaxID=279359 RepID=A0A1H1KZ69_9FLAO|nr:hypothetical protein SAMN04488552_0424 [Christiangramia echinicola]